MLPRILCQEVQLSYRTYADAFCCVQVITQLRSLTAALFGIACGILGLESYYGFAFYLFFTTFMSFLIWALMCKGRQGDYFQNPLSELWSGDLMGSALGFVLFWTAGYGIVRA